MKNTAFKFLLAALLAFPSLVRADDAKPATKHMLIVTVCKTYRHAAIPTGVKVVTKLGADSGIWDVDQADTDADLATKMSPDALKKLDCIFFLSTTGDIGVPDKAAFLDWIKAGHAFIGAHAATDTFHGKNGEVDPYIDMIGGEFVTHNSAKVDCVVDDPKHPADAKLPNPYTVFDEIYIMKNFSREKVHMLLHLDKGPGTGAPGYFPISWCKEYGQGKVFYTALGHEEAVWNSPEFQSHLLGGIKWALGLEAGDATPQAAK
jgi:type 1 glutamine amidotransferase